MAFVEQLTDKGGETLEEFLERLYEILLSGDRRSHYKTERGHQRWQERREWYLENHGVRALTELFPSDRGHPQFASFVNALGRADIYTVPQLIDCKRRLEEIRDVGVKRRIAARMIIDYFQSS